MLQPYEYNYVKNQISHLINIYKTVSDKKIVLISQETTTEKILPILQEDLFEEIKKQYLDTNLTNAKAVSIFERIKEDVVPFNSLSDKQIEKTFKKVKKLKFPNWEHFDLKETNYLAWDDIGAQRKYITFYHEGKLVGFHGTMSPNIIKSACAICHKIDNVAMFLTTTKSSGDGTYTKKGNYICKDSCQCNKQMESLDYLFDFYHTVAK